MVPDRDRQDMIRRFHDSLFACHLGVYRTVYRLHNRVYWPGLRQDVCSYLASCTVCLVHGGELSDGCSRWVIGSCVITPLQRSANLIPLGLVRILLCPWQVGRLFSGVPTIPVLGASMMGHTSQGSPSVAVLPPDEGAVFQL